MSKDTGEFTKTLVESNEIFQEAIRLLQDQIKKVTIRLEGLEKDLKAARNQLKEKNTEILRLKEIIKTYESEQKISGSKTDAVDLLLPQIKDLSDTIKAFQSSIPKNTSLEKAISEENHYEYEEVEVEDEEFNQLVEELEAKKLEIQSLQQEKIDLLEQEQLLKSRIVNLEQNIEKISESKISLAFNELRDKYERESLVNQTLEEKVKELEQKLQILEEEKKEEVDEELSSMVDAEHLTSLKTEVSKYIQENITLQEKLDKNAEFESLIEKQNEDLNQLNKDKDMLEQSLQQATNNYEHAQSGLIKLQEEHQSLELKLEQSLQENFDLKNDLAVMLKQLNEKEEELLDIKLKANQLEEKFDDSVFDKENIELSEESDSFNQNELLLKISELEMEEANWQDEKRVLLSTIDNLRSSSTKTGGSEDDSESIELKTQKYDHLIKNLKDEILELNQDLDDADSELKELEIENGVLRDRISELEQRELSGPTKQTVASDNLTELREKNTKLAYELNEKESQLSETSARLTSQEQRIAHLESLMDQERQLKEKFEFLYSGLKEKLVKKEKKREVDNLEAKKQLEQVVKSLNLSEELADLTTDDDSLEDDEFTESEETTSSSDDLGRALENTELYLSLIDKFLKPHVQITQLLKQGDWEINSLAELVGLERKNLMTVLKELSDKKIVRFDENKVWLLSEDQEN